MRRIISALFISISSSLALAQIPAQTSAGAPPPSPARAAPLELADGAPERHIVVPGDTLWGIASRFLKTPYRWGELWRMNREDIRNPHLIYPGQVLVLDKSGAYPRLRLETVKILPREYITTDKKSIPSIPPTSIEPFLSEPRVLDIDGLDNAPRVIGAQDNRVLAASGDMIYTTAVEQKIRDWQIFRPGKPLIDPETKEILGYEALYLGKARLMQGGEPARFRVSHARQEIARDDRLMPAPAQDVPSYIPRPPDRAINAKVVAVYAGINFTGPQSVVTLNRGKRDGLEHGHVLAADLVGATIDDRYDGKHTVYKLPDSRNGLLFVFRVFDRVSYALVMSGHQPVSVGDSVRTP